MILNTKKILDEVQRDRRLDPKDRTTIINLCLEVNRYRKALKEIASKCYESTGMSFGDSYDMANGKIPNDPNT